MKVTAGDDHTCFTTENEIGVFCFGKDFYEGVASIDPIEYPLDGI